MVRPHGHPAFPLFPGGQDGLDLRNVPARPSLAEKHQLCLGTVDAWLVWKLTGQYRTDYSNASRTQLFNIRTLQWDKEICAAFGIDADDLPIVTDSDAIFGETDLGGWLPKKIAICGVLGDSHAALFGQGCLEPGMTKATYGTGSSIMMNIGKPLFSDTTSPRRKIFSDTGLVTSLAWKIGGKVSYVMEGNLNYTGAVITWLKDSLGLIASAGETESLAKTAHPADTTCLVPAFTGLGAPYWKSDARAMLCGMSRTTGKNEIVRAALDSIAFQIHDVIAAMEKDTGIRLPLLRVDGGPTRNGYLMQFQSDLLNTPVSCPDAEELSGIGAAASLKKLQIIRIMMMPMGKALMMDTLWILFMELSENTRAMGSTISSTHHSSVMHGVGLLVLAQLLVAVAGGGVGDGVKAGGIEGDHARAAVTTRMNVAAGMVSMMERISAYRSPEASYCAMKSAAPVACRPRP